MSVGTGSLAPSRTELIDAVAAAADLPKGEASRAVEAVTQAIADELSKGGQVAIVGEHDHRDGARVLEQGMHPRDAPGRFGPWRGEDL